ncbi:MAG: hypothetical protein ABI910_03670 [Gemmatimonadota bacterium]
MRRSRPSERQFDLWPPRILVEEFDPRAVAGTSTRVVALYTVRYEREPGVHQVFFDHHGWYCADHGPACKAVRDVTARRERDMTT